MKKVLCLLTALILVLSLSACGPTDSGKPQDSGSPKTLNAVAAFEQLIRTLTVSDTAPVSFTADASLMRPATNADQDIVSSARAEACFIKYLLEDDGYVIEGKVEDCVINYAPDHVTFNTRMQLIYDAGLGQITAILNAADAETGDTIFVEFVMDYDVDTDTLNAYSVYCSAYDTQYEYYRYENGTLKILTAEGVASLGYKAYLQNYQREYLAKPCEVSGHDYSASYTKAMAEIFG